MADAPPENPSDAPEQPTVSVVQNAGPVSALKERLFTGGAADGSPKRGATLPSTGEEFDHRKVCGRFEDVSPAKRYFEQHCGPWAESLKKKERGALDYYKADGHADVNLHLREGTIPSAASKGAVSGLDSALSKAPVLSESMLFHRGSAPPSVCEEIASGNSQSLIGSEIADPGYVSTTANEGLAREYTDSLSSENTVLCITAPAGTKCAYLDLVYERSESEVLFARDTRMKITGVRREGFFNYVDVTIIPEPED